MRIDLNEKEIELMLELIADSITDDLKINKSSIPLYKDELMLLEKLEIARRKMLGAEIDIYEPRNSEVMH